MYRGAAKVHPVKKSLVTLTHTPVVTHTPPLCKHQHPRHHWRLKVSNGHVVFGLAEKLINVPDVVY